MYKMVVKSVNRMWSDYCSTDDGFLTIDQSRKFIRDCFGAAEGAQASQIEALFNKLDKNRNGKISRGEMADVIMKISNSKL